MRMSGMITGHFAAGADWRGFFLRGCFYGADRRDPSTGRGSMRILQRDVDWRGSFNGTRIGADPSTGRGSARILQQAGSARIPQQLGMVWSRGDGRDCERREPSWIC
jgi:hypothetical protein